jgi:hypothetical protein
MRSVTLSAGERTIVVHTQPDALRARVLAALDVDTAGWDRPRIT